MTAVKGNTIRCGADALLELTAGVELTSFLLGLIFF